MHKKMIGICLCLALLLLLAGGVTAMQSENYRLDWYVPLSGVGIERMTSPGYAVDVTLGQIAGAKPSYPTMRLDLGYWPGAGNNYSDYLPVLRR